MQRETAILLLKLMLLKSYDQQISKELFVYLPGRPAAQFLKIHLENSFKAYYTKIEKVFYFHLISK